MSTHVHNYSDTTLPYRYTRVEMVWVRSISGRPAMVGGIMITVTVTATRGLYIPSP